jgi:HEAT repeat protein
MVAHIILLAGGDPQAVTILDGSYGKEPDAEARVGTMYALGALADPKAIPALRRGLKDSELKVVKAAVEGLNQLQVPDLAEDLVRCLTDSNDQVRKNCATVLSGYPGKKTSEALMEAVKKDPSEQVRLAAVDSLGFSGGLDTFEFILGVLRSSESSAEMKSKAATALQSISNQDFGKDAGLWARWYEKNRLKIARP